MRLKDLRYLVLVGRTLCFREAARRCGVRSSTVIEQVNRVEQRLGARVFERSRNGLSVTPAGREILRLALGMTTIEEHLMRTAAGAVPARPAPGILAAAVAIPPSPTWPGCAAGPRRSRAIPPRDRRAAAAEW